MVELTKYISFAKKHFFNIVYFICFTSRYFAYILAELNFCEASGRDNSLDGDWKGS